MSCRYDKPSKDNTHIEYLIPSIGLRNIKYYYFMENLIQTISAQVYRLSQMAGFSSPAIHGFG
jgi:hypothetical protein